jgi:hypothetical protein
MIVRNYENRAELLPVQVGAQLSAPITGALTSGFSGPEFSIWSEWKLTQFYKTRLGFRSEADFSYDWWSSSDHSKLVAWALWVAPSVHF